MPNIPKDEHAVLMCLLAEYQDELDEQVAAMQVEITTNPALFCDLYDKISEQLAMKKVREIVGRTYK